MVRETPGVPQVGPVPPQDRLTHHGRQILRVSMAQAGSENGFKALSSTAVFSGFQVSRACLLSDSPCEFM